MWYIISKYPISSISIGINDRTFFEVQKYFHSITPNVWLITSTLSIHFSIFYLIRRNISQLNAVAHVVDSLGVDYKTTPLHTKSQLLRTICKQVLSYFLIQFVADISIFFYCTPTWSSTWIALVIDHSIFLGWCICVWYAFRPKVFFYTYSLRSPGFQVAPDTITKKKVIDIVFVRHPDKSQDFGQICKRRVISKTDFHSECL